MTEGVPIGSIDLEEWLHMYQQMMKIRVFEEHVNELYITAKMPGLAHLLSRM
jgi:pyruvate dehydrogenase E1 component alpha subunit